MSRVRAALALVGALVLAAGCSAPVDSGPKTIRAASIPPGLRAQTSSTTTTTVPPGASEEVTVYFISVPEGRLQPVKRRVSSPVNPEKVLQKLFAGPTDAEGLSGLRTAINGDTTILHADVEKTILTVDTSKNFAFGQVPDQIAAYAQVVFTAVELPNVNGVQFAQNGRRIAVYAGDGSSQFAPLGKASYAELTPR
ncbi:MAG: GerMN domain-containing protein [Actinomycetota bacterium]|jgi:spore germination protein GerM